MIRSRIQINIVDVDTKELINAWLVSAAVSAPSVIREYDISISRDSHTQKKIAFKNPWDIARRIILLSSDESLMKPRYAEGNLCRMFLLTFTYSFKLTELLPLKLNLTGLLS